MNIVLSGETYMQVWNDFVQLGPSLARVKRIGVNQMSEMMHVRCINEDALWEKYNLPWSHLKEAINRDESKLSYIFSQNFWNGRWAFDFFFLFVFVDFQNGQNLSI